MKTFSDHSGRPWTVALNVTTLKRIKALCAVDLMEAVNDGGKLIERLATDPVLLCDVLSAACQEQAQAQSVSDAQFGCAMTGDAIEGATEALLEELVDFFPKAKREVLRRALQKMHLYEEKFLKAAHLKLDDPKMDEAVDKAIENALNPGDSSGSAPAS